MATDGELVDCPHYRERLPAERCAYRWRMAQLLSSKRVRRSVVAHTPCEACADGRRRAANGSAEDVPLNRLPSSRAPTWIGVGR